VPALVEFIACIADMAFDAPSAFRSTRRGRARDATTLFGSDVRAFATRH
jgi:hypothetical protein